MLFPLNSPVPAAPAFSAPHSPSALRSATESAESALPPADHSHPHPQTQTPDRSIPVFSQWRPVSAIPPATAPSAQLPAERPAHSIPPRWSGLHPAPPRDKTEEGRKHRRRLAAEIPATAVVSLNRCLHRTSVPPVCFRPIGWAPSPCPQSRLATTGSAARDAPASDPAATAHYCTTEFEASRAAYRCAPRNAL